MLSEKPLKIAVTGGGGFLGSHLLPFLSTEGFDTACLARGGKKAAFPDSAAVIKGDCLDQRSLMPFLEGRDVLIHMASVLFAPSWQSYLESNVKSARNILAAMAALPEGSRPSRVIFISSLAAAGPCAKSPGLDEGAAPAPVSAYGWSKLFCERLFQEALGDRALILRPPIIYGSGDKGLLPMFKSAAKGIGVSPGARPFPVSVIHADDMARAIILLLKNKASGLYHLNDGKEHDMGAFCEAMGKAQGKKVRVLRPPLAVMGASAALCSAWAAAAAKAAGVLKLPAPKAPQWNLDKYREARRPGWLASAARIKREHGFSPRIDLESGMDEAVQGYRRMGLL